MSDDVVNQGLVVAAEMEKESTKQGAKDRMEKAAVDIQNKPAVQEVVKKLDLDKIEEEKENSDTNQQKSWVDIAEEAGKQNPSRLLGKPM